MSSNADSVVRSASDGVNYFVKPFEKNEPFSVFISQLLGEHPEQAESFVRYSQTRTACMLWPHGFYYTNWKLL